MGKLAATAVTLLLTAGPAFAEIAPTDTPEADRVGPLGILLFVVVFIALSIGMVGIAFWRKGGKSDKDKSDA